MKLKEFMETDIYKLSDVIEYVNKNGEEIEEDEENLLLIDVTTYHKSSNIKGLEIELNIE